MLGALSKNLRQMLYERLADSGVVRAERSRILGVVPVHRWPAQDASHEAEVRRLVTQVLVHQVAPDTRIAALEPANFKRWIGSSGADHLGAAARIFVPA